MQGKINHTSLVKISSAIFMILALLWLTVSTPFVYAASQARIQQQDRLHADLPLAGTEEESGNPLGNATEEKAPNPTFSEEFLHEHHKYENLLSSDLQFHQNKSAGIYIAFHGDLEVPPPDAA